MTQEIKPVGRLDADAFLSLVREFDLRHRRLAFRLLGDRDRMDDVLQEAYARAFRALPRFRPRGWVVQRGLGSVVAARRALIRRVGPTR